MAAGDPTGPDLASGTTNGDTLPTGPTWEEREITFGASYALVEGTRYAIVVRALSASYNEVYWRTDTSNPYANGSHYTSSDSGSSWSKQSSYDSWFKTKASGVEKDSGIFTGDPVPGGYESFYSTGWLAQTFIAGSSYSISSVVLKMCRWSGIFPGTITVSIRAVEGPGKATTPVPTDDQENIRITGKNKLKLLQWDAPVGETPDYLVYFRASGGSWELQETITDDTTEHVLSQNVLDALEDYSIYEWRVDTRDAGTTTTGDTWTFITIYSSSFTDYSRRSDYNADQVWQPGVGWVDINSFEYTGGGRYKGRLLVIGHKVIYFGDL